MNKVHLYPHQIKAVAKLHNGSILCGGVGTGKSRVAMQYYVEKEAPKDVYVITTAKKRDSLDWESEAIQHGIGTDTDASFHGVLKVDSWNNLWRYTDVRDAFFIFDEQRLVGSGAWVRSFYKIAKKNRWILLSATPGDTWMDYIPVFVANGLYKNKTEFQREHVIYSRYSKFPKVERYIGVGRLVRYRNDLLVEMPYERHTTRVLLDVPVEYDEDLYKRVVTKRWHPEENRPLRDVSELYSVMRRIVNGDASRLEAVRSLTTRHPKLIVFYNFDYELELLRTLGDKKWLTNGLSSTSSSKNTSELNSPSGNGSSSANSIGSQSDHESSVQTAETSSERRIQPSSESFRPNHVLASGKDTSVNGRRNTTEKSSDSRSNESFAIAEWNGHKHQEIPKTDRWVYLVQYTAGAEGWNCIETDAAIFFSLNYSYRVFEQCQGRIDRLNTPFDTLTYYIFKSKSTIDAAIWKVVRNKQTFNEKRHEKLVFTV